MVVMMFWYGGGLAWWQASVMWVGVIAFWGFLIWAVYALIGRAASRSGPRTGGEEASRDGARRILDERLARGEIDTDEYRRLRDVLTAADDRIPADSRTGG
jgi:putative membrane protein